MRLFLAWVLIFVTALPALAAPYRDRSVPMAVMAGLDVQKYLGLWYEIARFENIFERGCVGVTARYAARSDGQISVQNTCRVERLDGPVKQANGVARLEAPGRLSVTFTPWLPFARADYWVLYHDPGYTLAVVGTPKGTTGWILARSPQISAEQRRIAEDILTKNGYDIKQLKNVLQVKP